MSDVAATGAAPAAANAAPPAPAAAGEAPPPEAAKAAAEELIELLLEEGKPPVKVPVSKVNPHLAKFRAEADRRMSEADKATKAATERASKLENVLRAAKQDTDAALRELGIDPDEYAERKLAARVRAAMQQQEEEADPAKRVAREADEERKKLKDENEKLKKDQAERQKAEMRGRLERAIGAAVDKLPEALRDGARPVVIAVFRQAIAAKQDITIEEAAKAALAVQRERARKAYEADEELRAALGGKPPAAKPGTPAKPAAVEHPAARPATGRDEKGKFKPADASTGAGDVLLSISRGKFL